MLEPCNITAAADSLHMRLAAHCVMCVCMQVQQNRGPDCGPHGLEPKLHGRVGEAKRRQACRRGDWSQAGPMTLGASSVLCFIAASHMAGHIVTGMMTRRQILAQSVLCTVCTFSLCHIVGRNLQSTELILSCQLLSHFDGT